MKARKRSVSPVGIFLCTAAILAAAAGCSSEKGNGTAAASVVGDQGLPIATPRIVDGVDLCAVLDNAEIANALGVPVTEGPNKNPVTKGCSVATAQSTMEVEVVKHAAGTRVAVGDHSATAETTGEQCNIYVDLLPGGTTEFGSFLEVSTTNRNADDGVRCKQSSVLARALIARLPRG